MRRTSGRGCPRRARQMSDEMDDHWRQVDAAEVLNELGSVDISSLRQSISYRLRLSGNREK